MNNSVLNSIEKGAFILNETELHRLSKTELHCHLDGSLSLSAVRRLAALADIAIPETDEALRHLVTAPPDVESLGDYLKTFDFIRPLLQTPEALELAAYDVIVQAAEENVRYIEVRFAPELSMDQGMTATATIEAVLAGTKRAMDAFDIQANILVCGMRQSPQAVTEAIFKETQPFVGRGVGSADFAGNEIDFPTASVTEAIQTAQQLHIPLTFHAGECHCAQNIADAIALGIRRIGHATASFDQPALIDQIVQTGTTVELCLTSNLQTKAAHNLSEFPYQALKQAGAKITINTDNRTVSHTTLTREYWQFQQLFGTTKADFLRFNLNAVDAAFIDEANKTTLRERLMKEYE
ncbi:adenosine deaminase [Lacticaseibacillus saniviri JCM 17471 = DSM 24301]|uniref:Adenosine deaminase n=1 Tax=Lacticaseibacillus saniviri JCM 17471 = DSM 24301 TaxID=1293598 RepID=A0A0R2MTU9_9LACO|nr:adenosine deaminase [Lacticaseibacillus saniviri JCM 17471 = DSM 24301]